MNLPDPRAKLDRSLELRSELGRFIDEMLLPVESRPSIALRVDDATGEYVLYVKKVPDLSNVFTRVGLLVGDIVHNMRSALDHLVFELALLHTGGKVARPDRTQFTIRDCNDRFERAAAQDLAEVAPQHRDLIEKFQPYHTMDADVAVGLYFHPLAMLRDLSNSDKHRILTPVLVPSTSVTLDGPSQWVALGTLVMDFVARMSRGQELTAKAMVSGLELARLPAPAGTPSEGQPVGHALPIVAFEGGRCVKAVIDKIGRAVDRVLSEFECLSI